MALSVTVTELELRIVGHLSIPSPITAAGIRHLVAEIQVVSSVSGVSLTSNAAVVAF